MTTTRSFGGAAASLLHAESAGPLLGVARVGAEPVIRTLEKDGIGGPPRGFTFALTAGGRPVRRELREGPQPNPLRCP
jgi:hypothetical protein